MSLEQLKAQQTQLVLQRSQGKDIVYQAERSLDRVNFAIQVLEQDEKARAEALEESGAIID